MKLTKDQIEEIDKYLQYLGVKFIDVRIELIDHLATEFENESEYVLIGDFLRTKGNFVKKFQREWDKTRHWSHQNALIRRILRYFYEPKQWFIPVCVGLLIWLHFKIFPDLYIEISFFATLIIPQCLHFYIYYKPEGIHKKILSTKYILSIMALPSIFMYLMGIMAPILKENPEIFYIYWFFALVFNIAGLQEVVALKRKIVRTYSKLISN